NPAGNFLKFPAFLLSKFNCSKFYSNSRLLADGTSLYYNGFKGGDFKSGNKRCDPRTANPKRIITRSTCRTGLRYQTGCVSVGKWRNNSEYRDAEAAVTLF